MKTPWFPHSVILCVGALMLLTSCEYPYYPNGGYYGAGPNQRAGTLYGAAGGALLGGIVGNQSRRPLQGALIGGVLGGLAGHAIGSSRDRYYTVRSGPVYGRQYYSSPYYRRPAYVSSYRRPPYRYSPYSSGFNHHPWGGYYGRSSPYSGWGTNGLGFGSHWF
jgi:hypothetical protein